MIHIVRSFMKDTCLKWIKVFPQALKHIRRRRIVALFNHNFFSNETKSPSQKRDLFHPGWTKDLCPTLILAHPPSHNPSSPPVSWGRNRGTGDWFSTEMFSCLLLAFVRLSFQCCLDILSH